MSAEQRRARGGEDPPRENPLREALARLDAYDPDGPRADRESLERRRERELLLATEKARWLGRC